MNQVIYFSRGGNTRKVAEAIAKEIGTQAIDVKKTKPAIENGIIFLGSGCYGGAPSPVMVEFIESSKFQGKQVALFGTSGGGLGRELDKMEETLMKKGSIVVGRYFCKGKTFGLMNRKHPDNNDFTGARKFAREIVNQL